VRVLGVDFGSKRIGLAVGDTEFGIASPRAAVDSKKGLAQNVPTLLETMKEEEAKAIIIGIPTLEERDSESAKVCRQFAQRLRDAGAEVIEIDEALTSVAADERLREHDWTAAQRDRHRDSEAACLILERFFAQHG
jgi:putative Holliday junction resolvase